MKTLPYRSVKLLLSAIPVLLLKKISAQCFTALLKEQALAAQLLTLKGKIICIRITDLNKTLYYKIIANKIIPAVTTDNIPKNKTCNVSISAKLFDLLSLMTRQKDADQLFFSKQITMEGETETGLTLRNILEGADFDWEKHFQANFGQSLGKPVFYIFDRLPLKKLLQ